MGPARVKALLLRFYEVPLLALFTWWMYRVRMSSLDRMTVDGDIYFVGTDPYYHLRAVYVSVAHFPWSLRFDPFTQYPLGTGTGQFGSLFDVMAAGLALLLGGGNPDEATIRYALAILPALLGAALAIPFYFLARAMTGRLGALVATFTLAFLPGEFLVRSLAGYADHHVAEALGMILAVLGTYGTILYAQRHLDQVRSLPRDPRGAARLLALGGLGGVGIAFYFLVWPPAVLIVGIFAVYVAIEVVADHFAGRDSRAFVTGAAIPFLAAAVLLAPTAETTRLSFNTFSPLQPLACLLVALGAIGLYAASRWLREREAHPLVLPAGGAAASFIGFFGLKLGAPGLYHSFVWGASWVTGVGVQRTMLTIAEARHSTWADFKGDFGLLVHLSIAILPLLVFWIVRRKDRASALLLVWSILMMRAAFTQIRFTYYLALTAALSVGWLVYFLAETTRLNEWLDQWFREPDTPAAETGRSKRRARSAARGGGRPDGTVAGLGGVGVVVVVALFVLPGLVIPTSDANGTSATECNARLRADQVRPAWALGECFGVDGDLRIWTQELRWMREHTPDVGLDLTDLHDRPAEGEHFEYPPDAYGVLSWWDYGHWTEVEAHRMPVANPFQQNAPTASVILTETDPARVEERIDAIQAENPTAGPVRYVLIDDAMAAGKYGAIAVWANQTEDEYPREMFRRNQRGELVTTDADGNPLWGDLVTRYREDGRGIGDLVAAGSMYWDAFLPNLYFEDGNGYHHYRLVRESPQYSMIGNVYNPDRNGYVERIMDVLGRGARTGAEAGYDSGNALVPWGNTGKLAYDLKIESALKTYERVEGAVLVGEAPAGTTVHARVPLVVETSDRPFTWEGTATADANGTFRLVVPYSTTDPVPVDEGGTDADVTAEGPYTVWTGDANDVDSGVDVHVPDAAVLQGDEVSVEL